MTIVQEVKKIIPSKLDDKAKVVYNRLKEETNNFDVEFLVVYADLEKAVEEFVEIVKKKYPDAIKIVRKKEKPTPPPPTPEPETDDKEVIEVMKDYRISETQAKKLVQLRRDASESKKESIDKMLDTLKKSEFYNARYTSKQNIDKNRTRDIGKDSNRGSLTSKDEMNMTGRKFKRISKAGHKNQYGTTEGGKVYYEYRANRRDIDDKIRLENGGMASQGRFKKRFNNGGMIDLFEDYENIPPKIQEILDFYEEDFQDGRYDGLSKALKEVEANGYTFEYYLDGEAYGLRPKNVPLNHIKGYEEYSKGGGVGKFKYERGQKFQDQYGDIILLDKYSDELWEARRWSGMRHVGDVVISEKDLDLIRTKKMAQGDLVQGRFSKHFKKGGWVLYDEDTQELINKYKTRAEAEADLYEYYGNANIVKESVWNETTEPKIDRFMFEEEMYEFKKGGKTPKDFENLKYGVKVIEIIGNNTNDVIVAMFKEKFERDAYIRKKQERQEERILATRKEIKNYDYQIIPIDNLEKYADGGSMYAEGGRVSEDVYYQMLGAVPPIFINSLDGKPQPNNTTFAVGEAYDFMETPMGYKAVYNAYSKKGNMYYDEGLVYFVSRGVAKTLSK